MMKPPNASQFAIGSPSPPHEDTNAPLLSHQSKNSAVSCVAGAFAMCPGGRGRSTPAGPWSGRRRQGRGTARDSAFPGDTQGHHAKQTAYTMGGLPVSQNQTSFMAIPGT